MAALIELTRAEAELPLLHEFFDFAYSDEGANNPETLMLEREASGEMTVEIVTVNERKTVYFQFHKD